MSCLFILGILYWYCIYVCIYFVHARKREPRTKHWFSRLNSNYFNFLPSQFGKTLITELEHLFLNCHDSDSIKMQSCILTELETINTSVKNFKENANHVKLDTLPVSDSIILQASKCLNNAYLMARFESEGAMLSNSRCVQDVLENKKNIVKKLVPKCESRIISVWSSFREKRKRE